MMSDLIPINIVLADRTYRIKTQPEDEETIRRTVKLINDKIHEFKAQFSGKDMQDYIAMVIIWYATQSSAEGADAGMRKSMSDGLAKINTLLQQELAG